MTMPDKQIALRVSRNSIAVNAALSAFKLAAGIFGHSAAMISDAAHSLSDVLSTFIVIIGVKLSNQKSDKEHPYGHERLECAAALILSAILFATGIGIGWSGLIKIIRNDFADSMLPGSLALIASVISIIVKELMYQYTKNAAKRIDSGTLMAEAWHHRSDALSSVGSFIGILGARLGFPILDPLACMVICLFILKAAISICLDSISKMTDRACDDEVILAIHQIILSQDGVLGVDQIKTRLFGNKIYVDVEIHMDGSISLYKAHHSAHMVHDAIESHLPKVKHCMVHVNPTQPVLTKKPSAIG